MSKENNKFLSDKVSTIILTDESLRDYVTSIISKTTGIDYDLLANTLVLDSKRINANINTKYSEVDAIYHSDDIIFNIEVNLVKGITTEKKNFRYICNSILKQVPPGSKDKFKNVYQINISDYDILKKEDFIYQSSILDEKYHLIRSDFIKIIDINMDYLRKLDYNKIKEDTDSLEYLLYIFICNDERDRNKLYSDDEIMAKVNKKLEELTKTMDEVFLDKEEYWKEVSYEVGKEEEKIKIAKKMLAKGKDIEEIIEFTELTIEDIDKLREETN